MAITLELPAELERELADEAAHLGLSLAEYAARVLATGRISRHKPQTGAELVAYWQAEGLIGTRSDITDSQQHARRLRDQAEQRT